VNGVVKMGCMYGMRGDMIAKPQADWRVGVPVGFVGNVGRDRLAGLWVGVVGIIESRKMRGLSWRRSWASPVCESVVTRLLHTLRLGSTIIDWLE
jgi:hypothetical protein